VWRANAPTGARTGAEARNGTLAVAKSATATIAVAINLFFGGLALRVRDRIRDLILGVSGCVGDRLSYILHESIQNRGVLMELG